MVHVFAALGFALVAAASTMLIWSMLAGNRAAIVAALGLRPTAPAPHAVGRRIRVRSVPSATMRSIQLRRAA